MLSLIKKIHSETHGIILWCAAAILLQSILAATMIFMVGVGLLIDEDYIHPKSKRVTCICYCFYETFISHMAFVIVLGIAIPLLGIGYLGFMAKENYQKAEALLFGHLEAKVESSENSSEESNVVNPDSCDELKKAQEKQKEYTKVWMKFQCLPLVEKEIAEANCYGADFLGIDIATGEVSGEKYVPSGTKVVYRGAILEGIQKVTGIRDVIKQIEDSFGSISADYTDEKIILEW